MKTPPSKLQDYSLFPEYQKKKTDKFMRDELNLAKYPLCLFSNKEKKTSVTFYPAPGVQWMIIANKEAGSDIPLGRHLDYLYAMLYLLAESTQYKFDDNTIYFTFHNLIITAGKIPNKEEFRTAMEALINYKWLGIKSTLFKFWDEKEIKSVNEAISIIQSYTIIGGLKRGKKKKVEDDPNGYCKVVFSDYIVKNLQSMEMSKKLNFSFLLRLNTPMCRRYFRLLDAWKEEEGISGRNITVLEREIREVATQIPISDTVNPSVIRRRIDPLHKRLMELNYLKDVKYEKTNGVTKVFWYFSEYTVDQILAYDELCKRGVSELAAKNIVLKENIERVMDCIRYYDIKKEDKKDKKEIHPGYLISILQDPDHDLIKKTIYEHNQRAEVRRREADFIKEKEARMIYEQHVETKLRDAIKKLSKKEMDALKTEAEEMMIDTPKNIRKESYNISLKMAINEIMRERLKLPTFDEWYEKNTAQEYSVKS